MKANTDFICSKCGKSDLVASVITLKANYGSKYDGEIKTYKLCGTCFDSLYNHLKYY